MRNRRYLALRIVLCLALVASLGLGAGIGTEKASADAEAVTVYASPDGTGLACTEAAPCSLTGARDKARTLAPTMESDIRVVLRGGTYALAQPLVLTGEDSGRNGFIISYQADPGETPVWSGGEEVTGWTLHDAAAGIYRAAVGSAFATRQLYVDGVRAIRAQGPAPAGMTRTKTLHTTTDLSMQHWGNPGQIEFVYRGQWAESRCGVSGISEGDITMKPTCWNFLSELGSGLPTSVENAYELLDEEGEWYLDETAHNLYYKPPAGAQMNQLRVVAPLAETLLKGEGTLADPIRDVEFRGITFAYATWMHPSGPYGFREIQANLTTPDDRVGGREVDKDQKIEAAVTFNFARNITFERNIFEHLGAAGLELEGGSQSNLVQGNIFRDISGNGIMLGGVSLDDRRPESVAGRYVKDNVIRDNVVHDIGMEFRGAVAIWAGYTENTLIAHNEIFNVPYSGISVGWGWGNVDYPNSPTTSLNNKIHANHVHDHMQLMFDGGGIYTLGEQRGMEIKGNVVHDQAHEYAAFYLDDGSRHITLENNVAYRSMRNIFAKGRDHTITGNYWDSDRRQMNNTSNSAWGGNTVSPPGSYPPGIVSQAGLTSEYTDLLGRSVLPHEAVGSVVYAHDASGNLLPEDDQSQALSAVDGDLTTVAAPAFQGTWSLTLDMGEIKTLEAAVVTFAPGGTPASYKIETGGSDGWTVLGDSLTGHEDRTVLPLGDRAARLLRITSQDGTMAVSEVEVYAGGTPVPLPSGSALRIADGETYQSDTSAVSVTGDRLTGISPGEATLEPLEPNGDASAFTVSVREYDAVRLLAPERIAIGRTGQALLTGVTEAGLIVPFPQADVDYSSSEPTRIETGEDGSLQALSAGTATIQANASVNGAPVTGSQVIEAYTEKLAAVTASLSEVYLHPGEETVLAYDALYDSGYPVGPADLDAVAFASSDPAVATVDGQGGISAVGPGHAVLTVTATAGQISAERQLDLYVYPNGWEHANVGRASQGEARYDDGRWTIRSSGDDINGTYDEFGFVYREIDMADYPTGVSVTATIDSIDQAPVPTTMSGLMLRQSLSEGSPNANYRVYSLFDRALRDAPFVYRTSENAASGWFATEDVPMPVKIRLTYEFPDRKVYAHYFDETSERWKFAGWIPLDLGDRLFVGMVHSSKEPNRFSESTFSDIAVTPALGIPLRILAATHLVQKESALPLTIDGERAGSALRFSSSNEAVAAVDENGLVTGVGPGNAVVTVEDGEGAEIRSDAIRLSVYEETADLTASNEALGKPAEGVANDLRSGLTMHQTTPATSGNDGNPATFAQATGAWAWSYKIDLGSLTLLDGLKVTFKENSYATKFEFLTSTDLETWDSAGIQDNTTGGVPYASSFGISGKMARYVAVRALTPNGANQTGGQMAVAELEALARVMPGVAFVDPPAYLPAGKSVKLQAKVLNNAADKSVTWSSDNPSVAAVDANGTLSALRPGSAVITVADVEGHEDTHALTVRKSDSLALNKPSEILKTNLTDSLAAQPTAPAANGNDGNLATRAQATGDYAWAYLVDLGSRQSLDGLAVTFAPTAYATKFEFLVSSDRQSWETVGTFSSTSGGVRYQLELEDTQARYAVVRALAPFGQNQPGAQMGVAEFEAYAYRPPIAVTGIQMDASPLVLGKDNQTTLQAAVLPADADNAAVHWSSSDPAVAGVNADGVLTALSEGTAVLTATTEDGAFTAQRTVDVRNTSNIALQKPAKATTANMQTALNTHASAPAASGNDGNAATRAQAIGSFAWAYQIDLGELRLLSRLAVTFASNLFATEFDFLTSTDGTTWTVVRNFTGVDGTITLEKDLGTGTLARFAAVRAIKPNAANQTGGQMAIAEFAVFSPENDAPTAISLSDDSVGEELAVGSVAAVLAAEDPDGADRHTFALVAGTGGEDNAAFTLDGALLRTNAEFDRSVKDTYRIRLQVRDVGNAVFEQAFTLTIVPGPDTQPPTKPGGLAVSDAGRTALTLTWSPATDNVGVSGYDIHVNGSLHGSVSGAVHAYEASALAPGTLYILRVTAKDEAGNESLASDPAEASTLAVATGIALDRSLLTLDPYAHPTETLHATVLPAHAVDKSVTWSSSDSAVAVVDGNGQVTAVAPGTATVTATTTEGGHAASASVQVNPAVAAMLTGVSQAFADRTFTLTYGLTNVASTVGSAVYAQTLTVTFDPAKVEFLTAESLREGVDVIKAELTGPGVLSIVAASQGAEHALIADGGTLRLEWRALNASQTTITGIGLTSVILSDGLGQETPVEANTFELQILYVDKTALNALIAAAQSALAVAAEGYGNGQYPPGSKAALAAAVADAAATALREDATQQETDAAENALRSAFETFQNAVITLLGDLNGDGLVRIGDLGILAARYGKTSASPDWDSVKQGDLNGDGKIDLFDMVILALRL